jgi:Transglycosylase SLT domain
MNPISQSNRLFPNSYGVVSTIRGPLCGYLNEILMKISDISRGMFFVAEGFRFNRKEPDNRVFFKTGVPIFAKKIDMQQAIRYGAGVYLAVAMLFTPVGICSRQNGPAQYNRWAMTQVVPSPSMTTIENPADVNFPISGETSAQEAAAASAEDAAPELPFEEHIMQAARTYQVDPALIGAIIMAESNYNPKAVSHRGAQGLMQLMPTTAKWLGIEDSFDPALNIDGGVRYFKKLLDRFDGDVRLALAAYNAGSRYVRKYGGVPPFRATRIYIKKVLHYHRLIQDQFAASGDDPTAS